MGPDGAVVMFCVLFVALSNGLAHLKSDARDRMQGIEKIERGSVHLQRLPDRHGGELVAGLDQLGAHARKRSVLADERCVDGPDQSVVEWERDGG